ncbi:MAG: histidine--tRNA ligase [Christensenellales bacterium]|jgi:histidyl-tRNA synthetase
MLNEKVEMRNLKGTFDFLPKEQRIRNKIISTLQQVFELYGYQPVETPILCHYDVLASKYSGGSEILKEVYKLQDQGERELALRYDLTVPFARLIAMNPNLTFPFKRYEIGKVYRDGPVKVGRNREFYQCDVDAIGVKGVTLEAELLLLAFHVFKKLEIDVYIKYNNRKLMSGLIEIAGINKEIVKDVITIVDKIKKITKAEFEKELNDIGLSNEQIEKLHTLFSMDLNSIKQRFGNLENQNINEGLTELYELEGYLSQTDILKNCKLDLSLARGHEIYTGIVFEVFTKDGLITSSIGGGGRFDKIITNFIDNGIEYPACGISFGLDVIYNYLLLTQKAEEQSSADLYIIPMGTFAHSMRLAERLREKGVKVEIALNQGSVSKEMKKANKLGMPFVTVIGEDEITTGKLTIKNMAKSEQKEYTLENIDALCADILRK